MRSATAEAGSSVAAAMVSSYAGSARGLLAVTPQGGSNKSTMPFIAVTEFGARLMSAYLVESIDSETQSNRGHTAAVWMNPGCATLSFGQCHPDVTHWVEFAGAQVYPERVLRPGRYRALRLEFCRGTRTMLRFQANGMSTPHAFDVGMCGVSLPLDPPLDVAPHARVRASITVDLAHLVTVSEVALAQGSDAWCTQGLLPQFCMQLPAGGRELFEVSVEVTT